VVRVLDQPALMPEDDVAQTPMQEIWPRPVGCAADRAPVGDDRPSQTAGRRAP
jgi:hypothetical protein